MAATGTAIAAEGRAIPAPPLRVSFTWTLAGNVIYAACQLGMLSVLAKLGTPAIVGQFALALAIAAPIFMFTNLQLRGVQATDSQSEFAFSDYFTLRCIATMIAFSTVVVIALWSRFDSKLSIIVILVAAAKAVESMSDIIAGLMQKLERLDLVATSLMIKGTASLACFTIMFWRSRSLIASVLATGVTWLSVLIAYDLRIAKQIQHSYAGLLSFSPRILSRLLVLSLPLGFVMALMSLNTNVPRYIVQHYRGASELGIYASLAYLGTATSLIINALGQSASSRLSRLFADRHFDAFTSLIYKLIKIGAALGIIGIPLAITFGHQALSFIYRPEYANYISVFLLMILTACIFAVASFLGYGLTAARCFTPPLIVVGFSTLTAACSSLLLIPRFGLIGAAWAMSLAALVQVAGFAFGLHRELKRARVLAMRQAVNYAGLVITIDY